MFDKNRMHFMNAYYKETEKPYGYLLVDNKPGTPADNQILADLFGECYAYHFGVNSTEPTRVETKPVGKHSTTPKTTSSRKKPVQTVTWSNASIPEWQKYTLGAPEVRKIPEGYVIIEMYNTSRNKDYQPVRGGVLINDENYWPVKLKHRSTGHTKWVNLHSDEPTVQSIVKETMENAKKSKINQMLVTRMLYLNKYVETNIINNTSYKFKQIKRSPKKFQLANVIIYSREFRLY